MKTFSAATMTDKGNAVRSNGLEGLRVVVTGGAAGIGRAVALHFAALGARVAALDRDLINGLAGVQCYQADVTDQDGLHVVMGQMAQAFGGIDVLVNNAGISFVGTVEDGSMEDWHRVFDINVLGYVRATRAALPYLRKSDRPAIVNLASCTATSGFPQRALYSATKGGVQSMTLAMAADLTKEGIRVNCVSPGTVDTPFMDKLAAAAPDPAAKRREFEARQPTGHMVDADEVAAAVAYLASPHGRSTVGTVLVIDGGLATLRLPRA
jgi:2-keto-3-deoxy-L-fuconate dehydrogenase